jgi:thiamine pyrophosphokinase
LRAPCGYARHSRMSVTGLLLTGGHGPGRSDLEPFLGEVGPIVAADSGFDLALALGLRPELIVGDMDSVRARLPQERVRRFPRDKEVTDTELGLQALKDLGCDRVVIAGGGGGRLDHLLFIVALFERETVPLCWITAHEHVEAIRGTAAYRGWVGQTVSFLPLSEGAAIERSEGLRWPLDGLRWKPGEGGVSNVITASPMRLTMAAGALLMIRSFDRQEVAAPPGRP